MSNLISIVGPWPRPIGGVSTFISRLVKRDNVCKVVEVIDPYYSKIKAPIPHGLIYKMTPFEGFLRWLWLCYQISTTSGRSVYINFSSPRSLVICLLSVKAFRKWTLTLHHGDLAADSKLMRWICVLALRRVSTVIALSSSQYDFYRSLGVANVKLASSYIALSRDFDYNSEVYYSWKTKSNKYQHLFVASGYPTKIYNHEHTINFVTSHGNAFLALFIYGPDSENMLQTLLDCNKMENCIVFYNRSEAEFNAVLKHSHVYLRPNIVDSFGIAVADAIKPGRDAST